MGGKRGILDTLLPLPPVCGRFKHQRIFAQSFEALRALIRDQPLAGSQSGVLGRGLEDEGISIRIPIPKSPNPGEFGVTWTAA